MIAERQNQSRRKNGEKNGLKNDFHLKTLNSWSNHFKLTVATALRAKWQRRGG
jgi:hypothetical protein